MLGAAETSKGAGLQQAEELFEYLDSDSKGYLSPKDLRLAFLNFGLEISRQRVYEIIADIQTNNLAQIDKESFINIVLGYNKPCLYDKEEDYKRVYYQIWRSQDNKLQIEDIEKQALNSGTVFNHDEKQTLKDLFKIEENQEISFERFYTVLREIKTMI